LDTLEEYLKTSPEDVSNPTYNDRFPGKSTCAIITAMPYHWFSKWRDEPVLHRGMEYEMLKKSVVDKMVAQVRFGERSSGKESRRV